MQCVQTQAAMSYVQANTIDRIDDHDEDRECQMSTSLHLILAEESCPLALPWLAILIA
jgi:hypothetical protein